MAILLTNEVGFALGGRARRYQRELVAKTGTDELAPMRAMAREDSTAQKLQARKIWNDGMGLMRQIHVEEAETIEAIWARPDFDEEMKRGRPTEYDDDEIVPFKPQKQKPIDAAVFGADKSDLNTVSAALEKLRLDFYGKAGTSLIVND